jgi:hypothetical protein
MKYLINCIGQIPILEANSINTGADIETCFGKEFKIKVEQFEKK